MRVKVPWLFSHTGQYCKVTPESWNVHQQMVLFHHHKTSIIQLKKDSRMWLDPVAFWHFMQPHYIHIPVISCALQRPDSKNWRSGDGDEELWGLPNLLNSTQPYLPLPASGSKSCGEDVNWDWNNKQFKPLRHLELTEKEAAEGAWI